MERVRRRGTSGPPRTMDPPAPGRRMEGPWPPERPRLSPSFDEAASRWPNGAAGIDHDATADPSAVPVTGTGGRSPPAHGASLRSAGGWERVKCSTVPPPPCGPAPQRASPGPDHAPSQAAPSSAFRASRRASASRHSIVSSGFKIGSRDSWNPLRRAVPSCRSTGHHPSLATDREARGARRMCGWFTQAVKARELAAIDALGTAPAPGCPIR